MKIPTTLRHLQSTISTCFTARAIAPKLPAAKHPLHVFGRCKERKKVVWEQLVLEFGKGGW